MAIEPSIRMGLSLTGGWSQAALALGKLPFLLQQAQQKALLQEAEFFRTKIVEGIRDQAPGGKAFKPLSPYTIAMRYFMRLRSDKALIERGDLIRNIVVHRVDANNVFVGILRGAVNSEGKDLVNIAKIHEYGAGPYVVRMTRKMRMFLAMVFRQMQIPASHGGHGSGEIVITIPPRPFLGPVFDKYGEEREATERFSERMGKLLGGVFAGGG